jgi:hypothetical protein
MTPRTDFLAVLLRQQLRMDAERRAFAEQVSVVVRNTIAGRETFDILAYTMISRDIERVFDTWYGAWPSDPRARFLALIVEECKRAKALAAQRAVEDVTRRLKAYPAVLREVLKEAA